MIDYQSKVPNTTTDIYYYFYATKSFKLYSYKYTDSTNEKIKVGYSVDPINTPSASCSTDTYYALKPKNCGSYDSTIFKKGIWHNVILYADSTQNKIWIDFVVGASTNCVYCFEQTMGDIIFSHTTYSEKTNDKVVLNWGSFTIRDLKIWQNDSASYNIDYLVDSIRYLSYL